MSDKSFGDYANKNIVKNPLLSTAVTGLSIEDLTHNAVLVPVAPNQTQITGPDQSGTYTQTLANTDHDHTNLPSGDSHSSMLHSQSPISTYSHSLDTDIGHNSDRKPELHTQTVSKASAKSEDDFDVNEYFARLQGTRYVSAPLHSHPDPNTNLTETEENLEEINLNDDKALEVQQSLTADIAQNFSQLPNVLPQVASAVFSSFSNIWSMKSREQTPDDRAPSYHDVQCAGNQISNQFEGIQGSPNFQDIQFQGTPGLNQFQSQELGSRLSNVPLMKTEEAVKEVAPPPKEPPICGTSNFRLTTTKKKYAQIPGLSSGASQQITFNPLTQNVPSYFIPTEETNIQENREKFPVQQSSNIVEETPEHSSENYNIHTPLDGTITASDFQHNVYLPADNHPKLLEETPPPINLQNQIPNIPPPPMFSTQRRESSTGKSVLPPSVARRIGSNHPVIKQQIMQPTLPDNIFIPTFDPTPSTEQISADSAAVPTYGTQIFAPNTNQITQPVHQDVQTALPTSLPAQTPKRYLTELGSVLPLNTPPLLTSAFHSEKVSNPGMTVLPGHLFEPSKQTVAPAIFTPFISDSHPDSTFLSPSLSSPLGSTSLGPPANVFSPPQSVVQTPSVFSPVTTVDSYPGHNPLLYTIPISETKELTPVEPPKPLIEPPKAIGASNFRMTKKRPQYYSGPIEGFGSISNSIKPTIPSVETASFQGALFTPEQLQSDSNTISFDISKQTDIETSYKHFDVSNQPINISTGSFMNQESKDPSYITTQPCQGFGQEYHSFDLNGSASGTYAPKEELKESKGFGIIGSLKSKLSNLDINKIQNSVTTFFDPGYNSAKTDELAGQKDLPCSTPQYHVPSQSNFEMFMPNIEQNVQYSSSSQDYQNTYGQVSYDHPQQYSYQYQNFPSMDPNYSNQTNPMNYYANQTQNQPQISNVYSQENPAEIINRSAVKIEDNAHIFSNIQTKDASRNNNGSQTENTLIAQTVNIPAVETASVKSYFDTEGSLQNTETKQEETTSHLKSEQFSGKSNVLDSDELLSTKNSNLVHEKLLDVIPCPGEYKDKTGSNPTDTNQPTTIPDILFDSGGIRFYETTTFEENQYKIPPQCNVSDTKSFFDKNISESGMQGFSSVPILTHDVTKNEMKSVMLPTTTHDLTDKEESSKEDCFLIKPLTNEVPILGVSAVPLDLATIIADKAKETNENEEINLPLYKRAKSTDKIDQNASISFFESMTIIEQTPSNNDGNKNDYNLDRNRNLNFEEKSSEMKDKDYGAQISSSNFFSKDYMSEGCEDTKKSYVMIDKETDLFENLNNARTEQSDIKEEAVIIKELNANTFKDVVKLLEDDVTELNICETCREVNKPEEKETEKDNLTLQLIENVTAPIQLSNPVEVPLPEENNAERVDFDVQQFEELSHITEETIETIHVQSASELLEEDHIKSTNYGWGPEENYASQPLKHYDHSYIVDPSAMGFFDTPETDKVQANASSELKAEFRHLDLIFPRQVSIPTAPPAEEDSKSDEGGILDVHSIELDAKEDFPVYEEFVIEPSETDDDKIEFKEKEKTEESELDSFTNRVEKFKKMEDVGDVEKNKTVLKFCDLNNQPISMASYFDTGNYAADTHHYRNMLTSPNYISIPPGFEAEFKKRLALCNDLRKVPETSTQTKSTISVTTAHSVMPVGFHIVGSNLKSVEETLSDTPLLVSESIKTTAPSSIFDSKDEKPLSFIDYGLFDISKRSSEITSEEIKPEVVSELKLSPNLASGIIPVIPEASSMFVSDTVEMPTASSIFGSRGATTEASNIFGSSEPKIPYPSSLFNANHAGTSLTEANPSNKEAAPTNILPDPINFFSDSTAQTPENVNRLASYFSSPPKTDHAKSFFELSQSQNHYKHVSLDRYEDLIKDLTSVQNLAVPTDQTIRHVNYFTVEHDVVLPEFSKGDSSTDVLIDTDDKDFESLNHCSYCTALIYNKRYKVKASMNNNSEERTSEANMEITSSRQTNSVTVNFDGVELTDDANEGIAVQAEHRSSSEYGPVKHHWFYRVDVEDKSIWRGFSVQDSRALESSFLSPDLNENTLVPTDGGRYDVNLMGRLRIPVYWTDKPTNVRRCSWFYKGTTDPRYVPYTENVAQKLEEEYGRGMTTGEWHRRLALPNGEVVVMHGPNVMVHFLHSDAFSTPPPANPFSQLFSFGKRVYRNPPKIRVSSDQPPKIDHLIFLVHGAGEYRIQKEKLQSCSRPRVVRRGHEPSEIEDAEPSSIDHLLLLCHGVGSACDMRFRSVEEVVEDFRTTSLQLVQSHYKNSYDQGIVSRVEVLPISWHASLHSGETGVDRRLAQITLDSIPRLRNFTNDTVLDVLFYTSPIFCQTIVNTVCNELNRLYDLFKKRNPTFEGGVSLGGHSLGSVILYDLLCHQPKESDRRDSTATDKQYVTGPAGTGRPGVLYPQLKFEPAALYALGSPIAIFECIRGVESLGTKFSLPTCKKFFNIFHPYDPIAYRIEPLINPRLKELKPYLIPHHKGRKRMHLELKDTMARVGADLKQKLMESLRSTWNKWKATPADGSLDRVVEEDLDREQLYDENKEELAKERELSTPEMLGHLNEGRRVDYVLQEAPLEMINEYLFAMSSHVGYWESEDTMLLMLREIYSTLGVQPDSTVPQQSMSVQRTRRVERPAISSESPSTSGSVP